MLPPATLQSAQAATVAFPAAAHRKALKWVAADQATSTIYVFNGDDGTASVLNAATCNATPVSGCN